MKKLLCIILALAMMISIASITVASADIGDEVTIAVMDKGRVAETEGTMEENRWTTWMREQTGLNLKWMSLPRNGFRDAIGELVAIGDAPDIIVEFDQTFFANMASEGLIIPLDDVLEEYAPNYYKFLQENDDIKNATTFYDGHIYALTSFSGTKLSEVIWLRQDWLDQLGLSQPTSTEELIEVARAFKEAKIGGEDTIPIVLNSWQLGGVFGLFQAEKDGWYVDENGKVEFGPLTDRFKGAVTFLKTLYDEGLIMRDYPTDTDLTLQKQLWINGQAGILLDYWYGTLNKDLLTNNPEANIQPLAPITTEFGENSYVQGTGLNYFVAINKDCKNVEGALKYLDWMFSTGWEVMSYGLEGVHYNIEDGKRVAVDDDDLKAQIRYTPLYAALAQEEPADKELMDNALPDEISQKVALLGVQSYNMLIDTKYRKDIPQNPDVEEFNNYYAEWTVSFEPLVTKAITAGASYTPDMLTDELRSIWEGAGGAEIVEKVQAWYDANKINWQ